MREKIHLHYVREQKRYTKNELRSMFKFDDESGIEQFIKSLKAYGVLKTVKNCNDQLELTDLLEDDIQIADEFAGNDEFLYVFTYVGIIIYKNRVVKIIPKYMLSWDKMENEEPVEDMKQIIKVLEKYSNSEEQVVNLFNGDGENRSYNLLAVILYLLNDYYEYGIYNNREKIVEINGEGPILWGKTIDEGLAIIKNNRPYYMEMYTTKSIDDKTDFFRRLHECIITECSLQLRLAHLDEIFEMSTVELSEEELEDFGDKEYILDCIQTELNCQFNTRRQILLKTMYTYVAQNRKMLEDEQGICMYGTTAFNMVWESVCSKVFNNKLHSQLGNLGLSVPLSEKYDRKVKLIDIIEKPVWSSKSTKKIAKDTLIPDLISIGQRDGKDYFVILDAKYYNIQLEKDKKLRGNPGIGDVTKQYLYQLAYKTFIEEHNIHVIKNCFLMPTEHEGIENKGEACLPMLNALGLEDIQLCVLSAELMYKHYLANKHMDVSLLDL